MKFSGFNNTTKIGIGTTSPARTLDVQGPAGNDDVIAIRHPSGGSSWLKLGFWNGTTEMASIRTQDDNSHVSIFCSTTERMRIQSDGNVGIGTTAPSHKLEVAGSSDQIAIDGDSGSYLSVIRFQRSGAAKWGLFNNHESTDYFGLYDYTRGDYVLVHKPNSDSYFKNGYVGIGTATPNNNQNVTDRVQLAIGNTAQVGGRASGTPSWFNISHGTYFDGTNWKYYSAADEAALVEGYNGGLYARMAVAGTNAGDNITWVTALTVLNTGYVHMDGAAQVRLTLGSQGTPGTNDCNWIRGTGTSLGFNTGGGATTWEVSGTERMRLDASGNLTINGNISNTADAGYYYLNNAGTGNSGVYIAGFSGDTMRCHVPANKYFEWEVGGAQRMKLDSSGLLTITESGNAGGINLPVANSRIYFGGTRAIEGTPGNASGNLTLGEGYTSGKVRLIAGTTEVTGALTGTTGAFSGAITGYTLAVTADNSGWNPGIHLKNTNADSSPAYLKLEKISASPANGDYIGGFVMAGRTSTGAVRSYVEQWCVATNVTNGSEGGRWNCGTWKLGVEYPATLVCAGNDVGIGVVPTAVNTSHDSLQIGGNTNIQSYGTQGAGGEVDYCHNVYLNQDGNYKLISADEATMYRQGGGKHTFYSWASGSAGSNVTVTGPKLMILADGKVGIGGTPTTAQLDILSSVSGNYLFMDDGANCLWKISSTTTSGIIQTQATGWSSWKPMDLRANYFQFKPNNSEVMRITSTGVGIGTTAPSKKLHLYGSGSVGMRVQSTSLTARDYDIYTDGDEIYIEGVGGSSGSFQTGENGTFGFKLDLGAPANSFYLNGSGNVGIGTASPEYPLHISNADSAIYLVGSTQGRIILQDTGATSNSQAFDIVSKEDKLHFRRLNDSRGSVQATVMVLSGDKVGIGTTSPAYDLQVAGNIDATRLYVNAGGNATDPIIRVQSDTNTGIFFPAGDTIAWTTGGSERMRIDAAGKVGIGTDSPILLLHLYQAAGANIQFSNATTGRYFRIGEGVGANDKFSFRGNSYRSTDTLTVDFANNRVGVANISPGYTLDVNGTFKVESDATFDGSVYVRNANNNAILLGKGTRWGYSSGYKAIQIGDASGTYTVCIGYDPAGNANGSFTGDGGELLFRNDMTFVTPNAADNAWHKCLHFKDGNVTVGSAATPAYKLDVQGTFRATGILYANSTSFFTGATSHAQNLNTTSQVPYVTFYGDSSANHAIGSRNSLGNAADDLRINTYGALYINLDSNNNNTSGADFGISRHGGTGTISDWLVTLYGETGQFKLHTYGSGTHTGTATYKLSVDSSGNFIETAIGAGAVDGAGTANYVAKWTDGDTIGNSTISDNGSTVTVASDFHVYKVGSDKKLWLSEGTSGSGLTNVQLSSNGVSYLKGGSVGIGTTAPSAPLHVYGTSANVKLSVQNSGGVTWSLNSTSGNTLNIDDAAYNKFRILSGAGGAIVLHPDGTGETYILGGSVAIGHSNPSYKLDVSGTFRATGQAYLNGGLRVGGANGNFAGERLFNMPAFANGVANQKIDLYWTGAFWGYLEIEITGSYSNQNMAGVLTKSFALGLNASNAIYTNESWYSNVGGVTNNNFAISGVTWDSTNSRYRIQIVHRVSTGNGMTLKMKCLGTTTSHVDTFMSGTTVSAVYTTDTTAFALPVVQLAAPGDNAWVDGYLGIGTATPAARLHVHNTSSGSAWLKIGNATRADGMLIGCDSNELQQIYVNGANPLTFWTNDTERMRIISDGKVGIGTTAPARLLHVYGANDVARFQGAGSNYIDIDGSGTQLSCTTNLSFRAALSGNAMMTIKTDGKVGIGTTAPATPLHVRKVGDPTSSGNRNTIEEVLTLDATGYYPYNGYGVGISFKGEDYGNTAIREYAKIQSVMTDHSTQTPAGDPSFRAALTFWTNTGGASGTLATEKVRIAADGKVGIGTTAPVQKLDVAGNINITGADTNTGFDRYFKMYGNSDPATNTNRWAGIGLYNNGGNNVNELAFFTGTGDGARTEKVRINNQGNVGIGTTAPATLFDAKSSRTHNFIGRFVNTSTVGWGAYIEGGGDSADYSLLIRNQASSDLFAIMGDGEIRVANQTLVDNANTNYKMTFPDNSGIAMGSAYTFANIYGSSGNLYLRANAYPANTGSTSKIYLQTANSSGGQASDVVVNNGNFGIGTASPGTSTKLQVAGRGLFTGGSHDPGDGSPKGLSLSFQSDVGVIRAVHTAVTSYDISIQPTAGKVGIGILQPTQLLHLSAAAAAPVSLLIENLSGSTHADATTIYKTTGATFSVGINATGVDAFKISENADIATDTRLTIIPGGNVGIGNAAPAYRLEVTGSATADWISKIHNTATTSTPSGLIVKTDYNSATATGGYLLGLLAGTDYRLVVQNDGNVGIGTITPAVQLHLEKAGGVKLRLKETGAEAWDLYGGGSGLYVLQDGTFRFAFRDDGTQNHYGNRTVNSQTVQGLQDGGACYNFDGSNDYIELASNGKNYFGMQQTYTIAGWVNMPDATPSTSSNVIFSYDYTSHANPYYAIHIRIQNAGKMEFYWNDGSNYKGITTSAQVFTDNTWHHFACTYTSGTHKIYIDGVEVTCTGDTTQTGTITFYDQEVWIGKGNFGGNFPGKMRSIRYFPSSLSAGDVQKLYNGENPKRNTKVDLLTNGDFSSATGWSVGNWTVSGGKAVASDGDGYMTQGSVLSTSKKYLHTITLDAVSGNLYLYSGIGAPGAGGYYMGFNSPGTYTFIANAFNSTLGLYCPGGTTATVDSIRTEEITTLVDLTPRSGSPTVWYNSAVPQDRSPGNGPIEGAVSGATLSSGATFPFVGGNLAIQDKLSVGDLNVPKTFTGTVDQVIVIPREQSLSSVNYNGNGTTKLIGLFSDRVKVSPDGAFTIMTGTTSFGNNWSDYGGTNNVTTMANNKFFAAINNPASANVQLIGLNTSNQVSLGPGGGGVVAAGNVGIGTTTLITASARSSLTISTPSEKAELHLQNRTATTSSEAGILTFYNNTQRIGGIQCHADGATNSGKLTFFTFNAGSAVVSSLDKSGILTTPYMIATNSIASGGCNPRTDNAHDLGNQSYRWRQLHLGNFYVTGSVFAANTADGYDNKETYICAGGSQSSTRGSYIDMTGNDYPTWGGLINLVAGEGANAKVAITTGGSERMSISTGGLITFSGHIAAGTNNIYDIGAGDKFFRHAYLYYLHCSTLQASGNCTLGDASTDVHTINGVVYANNSIIIPNASYYFGAKNTSGAAVPLMVLNSSNAMILGSTTLQANSYPIRTLAKYITFEPAGTLGAGVETMRITNGSFNSVGSVGIGTASPGSTLHVHAASTATRLRITSAGSGGASDIEIDVSGGTYGYPLRVFSGAANKCRITTTGDFIADAGKFIQYGTGDNHFAGKLGIGTIAPAAALDVRGGTAAAGHIIVGDTGESGTIRFRRYSLGTVVSSIGGWAPFEIMTSGGASPTIKLNAPTVHVTGNVGIGNAAPSADTGVAKFLQIGSSAVASSGLVLEDNTGQWEMHNDTHLTFLYDGTERMLIGANGTVNLRGATNLGHISQYENSVLCGFIGSGSSLSGGTNTDYTVRSVRHLDFLTNNTTTIRMRVQSDGNVGIGTSTAGYKLQVQGDILASGAIMGNSKSFVIDHPTKPSHKLQYGALEGPEFGVYHRGRVQSDTIVMPDYWSGLVRDGTITVQLTPNGSFQHLYVVSTSLTEIKIGAADGETIDCYYTIYGERADLDPLVVEKIV